MAVSNEFEREEESEWSDFADINSDRSRDTFRKESVIKYEKGLFEECSKKIVSSFPENRNTKRAEVDSPRGPQKYFFEKTNLNSIIRYNFNQLLNLSYFLLSALISL